MTTRHVPFFNAELLRHWRYEPGIHAHWMIDGFANLFANVKTGLLFPVTLAFARVYRADRKTWLLIAGAYSYAAILIYVLAIDPKPRMMYIPLAALSLSLAAILRQARGLVTVVLAVMLIPVMALNLASQPRLSYWQRHAESLAALYPLKTDQAALFIFSRPLPNAGRPEFDLVLQDGRCIDAVVAVPNHFVARTFGDQWYLCLIRLRNSRPTVEK